MKKRALTGRSVGAEFSPTVSPSFSPSVIPSFSPVISSTVGSQDAPSGRSAPVQSGVVRGVVCGVVRLSVSVVQAGAVSRLPVWPRTHGALRRLWLGSVCFGLAGFLVEAQAQAPVLCSWGDRISQAAATPPDAKVVQRLLIQSETAYRDRRDTEAAELLYQILAQDPMLERAWFRLGNLMQRTGRPDAALAAYARAAAVDPTNEEPHRADRPTRVKASLNFAMLSMQRARDALLRVDSVGLDETTRFIYAGLIERVGDLTPIESTARTKSSTRRHVVGKFDRPGESAATASVVTEIVTSMATPTLVANRSPAMKGNPRVKPGLNPKTIPTTSPMPSEAGFQSTNQTERAMTNAVATPVIMTVPLSNSTSSDIPIAR